MACTCSVFVGLATSTTNVGRFSFSEPRPYETHEPEARPAGDLVAGLHVGDGRLVVDRLGVHAADEAHVVDHLGRVQGSSSLTHMPHWPCWANLYFDGAIGNRAWPEVIVVSRWPMRIESGRSLSYHSSISGL